MHRARLSSLALTSVLLAACTARSGPQQAAGGDDPPVEGVAIDAGAAKLEWRESPDDTDAVPVSLTASDGTGLELISYQAHAVLEGPLAFTELELEFRNPEPRVREGRFEINLPPGAAISRFAMVVGDEWQEAEVVERQAARQAYEDFLHRKQDPALLEQKAGNAFRARVFPIPAQGVKRIKIAYSQEMRASGEPYRIRLQGLPRLDRFDVDVAIAKTGEPSMKSSMGGSARTFEHLSVSERALAPRADLEVHFEHPVAQRGLRHERLALARVAPKIGAGVDPVDGLTLLLDTSASRALGYRQQLQRLERLVADLRQKHGDFPLQLVAFDQGRELIFEGPASGFDADVRQRLEARRALGASDLAQALRSLRTELQPHARVVVVTDGIMTAGDAEQKAIVDEARSLEGRGVRRIDALIDGGIQDEALLHALTRESLPGSGVVADFRLTPESLVHKLSSTTRSGVLVNVPGATWVWPERLDGIQPGDEVLVYADLPAETPMQIVLESPTDGQTQTLRVPTERAAGPLLDRAWTRAKLERMESLRERMPADDPQRKELKQAIIDLSTQKRVLSEHTALLVLETDADYQRFGIDRTALVDILTVGASGIELMNRRPGGQPAQPLEIATGVDVDLPAVLPTEADGGIEAAVRDFFNPTAGDQKSAEVRTETASPLRKRAGSDEGRFDADKKEEARPDFANQEADDMQFGAGEAPEMARDGDFNFEQGEREEMAAPAAPPPMEAPAAEPMAMEEAKGSAAPVTDEDVWGGLTGDEVGEAFGRGGLGLSGTGRGGGGTGEGTIGRGSPGSIGSGYGRGSGAGFGGRGARVPSIRQGQAQVSGSLDRDIIRRIVRAHINEVRACYNQGLSRDPNRAGRSNYRFVIQPDGSVESAETRNSTLGDPEIDRCVTSAIQRWRFPRPPGGGVVQVNYPFTFSPDGVGTAPPEPEAPSNFGNRPSIPSGPVEQPAAQDAWTGRFAEIMGMIERREFELATKEAWAWREAEPGSELALLGLGEAAEASGDFTTAIRAYGSLIDLFPSRADIRRMAGERLERVAQRDEGRGLDLAIDTYAHAVEQRPDHPASHRLLAYALLKAGRHAEAFDAIEAGAKRNYPSGRFDGVERILREDAGLIAAAWIAVDPKAETDIRQRVASLGTRIPTEASTRFVLNWETDANDVDFHIYDGRGGHAYFSDRRLYSGGELYADVTTGYGPECFTIPGKASAFPYTLQAHYYSMGPMGYGMGKLEIIEHDGRGGLLFTENPFVIMRDRAYVDLGVHRR